MNDEYNHSLCEERHGDIKIMIVQTDARFKKLENRFLAIMTTLVLNLIGVVVILAKTLMLHGPK